MFARARFTRTLAVVILTACLAGSTFAAATDSSVEDDGFRQLFFPSLTSTSSDGEVFPLVMNFEARLSPSDAEPALRFRLQRRDEMYGHDYKVLSWDSHTKSLRKTHERPVEHCNYRGSIEKGSHVGNVWVSLCSGFVGGAIVAGKSYRMYLAPRDPSRLGVDAPLHVSPFIMYLVTEGSMKDVAAARAVMSSARKEHLEEVPTGIGSGAGTRRRKLLQSFTTPPIVEFLIVNDKDRCDMFPGNVVAMHEHTEAVFIEAAQKFSALTPTVPWVIAGQVDFCDGDPYNPTMVGYDPIVAYPGNPSIGTDSSNLLQLFNQYLSSNVNDLPQFDAAHLFSGRNFNYYVEGLAYADIGYPYTGPGGQPAGSVCGLGSNGAISMVYLSREGAWGVGDNEMIISTNTVVHEVGHQFGMLHDAQANSCPKYDSRGSPYSTYMNPGPIYSESWSACSQQSLDRNLAGLVCLTETAGDPNEPPRPTAPPPPPQTPSAPPPAPMIQIHLAQTHVLENGEKTWRSDVPDPPLTMTLVGEKKVIALVTLLHNPSTLASGTLSILNDEQAANSPLIVNLQTVSTLPRTFDSTTQYADDVLWAYIDAQHIKRGLTISAEVTRADSARQVTTIAPPVGASTELERIAIEFDLFGQGTRTLAPLTSAQKATAADRLPVKSFIDTVRPTFESDVVVLDPDGTNAASASAGNPNRNRMVSKAYEILRVIRGAEGNTHTTTEYFGVLDYTGAPVDYVMGSDMITIGNHVQDSTYWHERGHSYSLGHGYDEYYASPKMYPYVDASMLGAAWGFDHTEQYFIDEFAQERSRNGQCATGYVRASFNQQLCYKQDVMQLGEHDMSSSIDFGMFADVQVARMQRIFEGRDFYSGKVKSNEYGDFLWDPSTNSYRPVTAAGADHSWALTLLGANGADNSFAHIRGIEIALVVADLNCPELECRGSGGVPATVLRTTTMTTTTLSRIYNPLLYNGDMLRPIGIDSYDEAVKIWPVSGAPLQHYCRTGCDYILKYTFTNNNVRFAVARTWRESRPAFRHVTSVSSTIPSGANSATDPRAQATVAAAVAHPTGETLTRVDVLYAPNPWRGVHNRIVQVVSSWDDTTDTVSSPVSDPLDAAEENYEIEIALAGVGSETWKISHQFHVVFEEALMDALKSRTGCLAVGSTVELDSICDGTSNCVVTMPDSPLPYFGASPGSEFNRVFSDSVNLHFKIKLTNGALPTPAVDFLEDAVVTNDLHGRLTISSPYTEYLEKALPSGRTLANLQTSNITSGSSNSADANRGRANSGSASCTTVSERVDRPPPPAARPPNPPQPVGYDNSNPTTPPTPSPPPSQPPYPSLPPVPPGVSQGTVELRLAQTHVLENGEKTWTSGVPVAPITMTLVGEKKVIALVTVSDGPSSTTLESGTLTVNNDELPTAIAVTLRSASTLPPTFNTPSDRSTRTYGTDILWCYVDAQYIKQGLSMKVDVQFASTARPMPKMFMPPVGAPTMYQMVTIPFYLFGADETTSDGGIALTADLVGDMPAALESMAADRLPVSKVTGNRHAAHMFKAPKLVLGPSTHRRLGATRISSKRQLFTGWTSELGDKIMELTSLIRKAEGKGRTTTAYRGVIIHESAGDANYGAVDPGYGLSPDSVYGTDSQVHVSHYAFAESFWYGLWSAFRLKYDQQSYPYPQNSLKGSEWGFDLTEGYFMDVYARERGAGGVSCSLGFSHGAIDCCDEFVHRLRDDDDLSLCYKQEIVSNGINDLSTTIPYGMFSDATVAQIQRVLEGNSFETGFVTSNSSGNFLWDPDSKRYRTVEEATVGTWGTRHMGAEGMDSGFATEHDISVALAVVDLGCVEMRCRASDGSPSKILNTENLQTTLVYPPLEYTGDLLRPVQVESYDDVRKIWPMEGAPLRYYCKTGCDYLLRFTFADGSSKLAIGRTWIEERPAFRSITVPESTIPYEAMIPFDVDDTSGETIFYKRDQVAIAAAVASPGNDVDRVDVVHAPAPWRGIHNRMPQIVTSWTRTLGEAQATVPSSRLDAFYELDFQVSLTLRPCSVGSPCALKIAHQLNVAFEAALFDALTDTITMPPGSMVEMYKICDGDESCMCITHTWPAPYFGDAPDDTFVKCFGHELHVQLRVRLTDWNVVGTTLLLMRTAAFQDTFVDYLFDAASRRAGYLASAMPTGLVLSSRDVIRGSFVAGFTSEELLQTTTGEYCNVHEESDLVCVVSNYTSIPPAAKKSVDRGVFIGVTVGLCLAVVFAGGVASYTAKQSVWKTAHRLLDDVLHDPRLSRYRTPQTRPSTLRNSHTFHQRVKELSSYRELRVDALEDDEGGGLPDLDVDEGGGLPDLDVDEGGGLSDRPSGSYIV
jgi:hypothetical protein